MTGLEWLNAVVKAGADVEIQRCLGVPGNPELIGVFIDDECVGEGESAEAALDYAAKWSMT